MKTIAYIAIGIAAISLIVGIISRVTLTPIGPAGIEAQAFLGFANTCLLAAVTLILLELAKK